MKEKNETPIYSRIIELYRDGTPIKEIAGNIHVSEVKVRRVLITEGEWSSPTSDEIAGLIDRGLNISKIAEKLGKPVKTVQAYMPYSRGEYNDGELSEKAKQSKQYRERKRSVMKRQVSPEKKEEKKVEMDRAIKKSEVQTMDAKKPEKITAYTGEGYKILRLHLELQTDLNDEEEATLRKYGKSEKGISRDILVPGDMMLHNLHYAIQRAFGWQNSHLHNFAYPENVFRQLTGNQFLRWTDLCGLYYRFPDAENEDLYWDDDYDESVSLKAWMKRKYTGPYKYGGISEHYMDAQTKAQAFKQQNPVLRIGPSFEEYMKGNKNSKIKDLKDITVKEISTYFESNMDELLERLPVGQVLAMRATENWGEKVSEIATKAGASFAENYARLRKATIEMNEDEIDKVYRETDPEAIPLLDTLIYSYDYGDGWEVEISCTEIYESFDEWKPVCIEADGLPVMDDVGGPNGYCAFLNGIHGEDCGPYDYENKEESIEWGRAMGWNGRMNKPENIL